jgi:hypothetical protein
MKDDFDEQKRQLLAKWDAMNAKRKECNESRIVPARKA